MSPRYSQNAQEIAPLQQQQTDKDALFGFDDPAEEGDDPDRCCGKI